MSRFDNTSHKKAMDIGTALKRLSPHRRGRVTFGYNFDLRCEIFATPSL